MKPLRSACEPRSLSRTGFFGENLTNSISWPILNDRFAFVGEQIRAPVSLFRKPRSIGKECWGTLLLNSTSNLQLPTSNFQLPTSNSMSEGGESHGKRSVPSNH
jgi:hypothetical protein